MHFYLDGRYVMYTVLSSLDACGCLGVAAAAAAAAGVFVVTRSSTRPVGTRPV